MNSCYTVLEILYKLKVYVTFENGITINEFDFQML